nr:MAG TPA: hypothetical protein [Caudoviricetes sp.]
MMRYIIMWLVVGFIIGLCTFFGACFLLYYFIKTFIL